SSSRTGSPRTSSPRRSRPHAGRRRTSPPWRRCASRSSPRGSACRCSTSAPTTTRRRRSPGCTGSSCRPTGSPRPAGTTRSTCRTRGGPNPPGCAPSSGRRSGASRTDLARRRAVRHGGAMVTIARNVVDNLVANGVQRIYGIAGDSLNGITEAVRTSDLDWVTVRHEEAAALAASAEAASTGRLAVCAGSAGPGNLHLINGLYDAQRSRVPVLALAAHIPSAGIGSLSFQEASRAELFRECSVWAEVVTSPRQMPRALRVAMQEAVSRQGVAVLVIPGDVALQDAVSTEISTVQYTRPRVVPSEEELDRAAQLLNDCSKVTILAGAGTAGAHAEVMALADTLAAPIVHAMRGKEHIDYDNPYDVGMTGLLGFASGYRAMAEAETLLMLGTDLPYQQFYPEDATVIQVDIRGGGEPGAAHQGRPGPGGGRGGDRPAPAAAAARQGPHPPGGLGPALPGDPPAAPRPAQPPPPRPASPAAVPGPGPGRAGVRGRRLHPRRGLARRVGGPVPDDERTATADRVVLARHHGQRPGAGHRRPVRPPRPAGRGHGRRRRPGDADGRAAHRGAAPAPGQGGRAQQLLAELHRPGDEGGRVPALRHRAGQPRLRAGRGGDGADGHPGHRVGGPAKRGARGVRPPWAGAARRGHLAQRADPAADGDRRAGQGVHPLHDPHGHVGPRRRAHRPGPGQHPTGLLTPRRHVHAGAGPGGVSGGGRPPGRRGRR